LKVERAEQHIRDAKGAIAAFLDIGPYEVVARIDKDTGQRVYTMSRVDPVPPYISGIIGDVLHNLRAALDHLAFALWERGSREGSERGISYPVTDTADPAKYRTERVRKIPGVRQQVVDAIDATEPYEGGAGGQLLVLHKLNNIDKHRRLNLAALHFGGFCISPVLKRMLRASARANPRPIGQPPPGYFFRRTVRVDALQCGDELYRCPAHEKVEDQTEFAFDVALIEPPAPEGESVVEFLEELTNCVRRTLDRFVPLL
jgi:hypothetical protein